MAAEGKRLARSLLAVTVGSLVGTAALAPTHGHALPVAFAWLLFFGSSVHVAATAALFVFTDVRAHARARLTRYVAIPLLLIALGMLASVWMKGEAWALLLLGLFSWQLWHYQKQNLGIAALTAAGAGVPRLTLAERRCITGSGVASVLALIAHPSVLQIVHVHVPETVERMSNALAICVLATALATMLRACSRRIFSGAASTELIAVLIVSGAFPLPLLVARSAYVALGGLTLAHGLQYLVVVGRVLAGPARRTAQTWRPNVADSCLLVAGMLAIAGVLSTLSHLHGTDMAARALFGAYVGVLATHFVVDAELWRMRDEPVREWLRSRMPDLMPTTG